MSNNTDIIKPSIGGHDKFVFRQPWLKKGFDVTANDRRGLYKEDSYIQLGVGKNMAEAIRFWCQAFVVIEQTTVNEENYTKGDRAFIPTSFGNFVFGDKGLDPYLEQYSTLWLLHWRICNNHQRGLINHIIFSRLFEVEFKKHHLYDLLYKELRAKGVTPTDKMVEKETDVFLRTYVPARNSASAALEESLDCPLADLSLITYNEVDDIYRFRIGPKNSLTMDVFQYCLVEYLDELTKTRKTASVDEFIYSTGSPGQFFKLDENSVVEFIEQIEKRSDGAIKIQETAGLRQVYVHDLSKLRAHTGLGRVR